VCSSTRPCHRSRSSSQQLRSESAFVSRHLLDVVLFLLFYLTSPRTAGLLTPARQ
jgi:hypothetical protein